MVCNYGDQSSADQLLEIKNYHHNHRLHCIHKGSWTMNKANQLSSTYNDMKRGFGLSDRCINHPRVFRSLYFRRQHKMCTIVNQNQKNTSISLHMTLKLLQVINITIFVYDNDKDRLIVMKYATMWRNYCYYWTRMMD